MGTNVTDLPRDLHRDLQSMLPWYVTGRLDAADRRRLEAHLAGCEACRAELRAEEGLAVAMAALPPPAVRDADYDWARLKRTLDREARPFTPSLGARIGRAFARVRGLAAGGGTGWMGVALASQACVIVALGAMVLHASRPEPALYHALSSQPVVHRAEIAVIFRPETPEKTLRRILNDNAARLVGGPTETDAYLLAVPPAERQGALARLRGRREVVLAEPLDGGAP